MKDGTIKFQGTFDDMAREDPEMYKSWQKEVIAASDTEVTSQSEGEVGYDEDRRFLQKQLSKTGMWDVSASFREGLKRTISLFLIFILN